MAPVVTAIRQIVGFAHFLVATGQQDRLFDQAVKTFGVTVDCHLGQHPGGVMSFQLQRMQAAIETVINERRPNLVLVQGDTNTAVAAARAATRCGIATGHVEAGLRTHHPERPHPEERNRVEIAQLAAVHFAPSPLAAGNLAREGIREGVFVTGNPGIDALMRVHRPQQCARSGILVTCHRRENFGVQLHAICEAVLQIANASCEVITLPVHPNPNVSAPIRAALGHHPNINLTDSLDYADMVAAVHRSRIVISDSGGLQEECAALGVPLLILRTETERPEIVTSGNAIIVGADTPRIAREAMLLLSDKQHYAAMARPAFPYGSGDAAPRIVDAIKQHFSIS